ncbi:MAG: hypothetical protein CMJ18_20930 [Phycisphaeraceae bacterium]|nr:hypothetical protein [Phycisphaeraceae bacterium]
MIWTSYYPEVAEIFEGPMAPWPCESIHTDFASSQPVIVSSADGTLLTNAEDTLLHSTDGGRTWSVKCRVPVDGAIPEGRHLKSVTHDGVGVTTAGTLLVHFTIQHNDGRDHADWQDESHQAWMYVMRSEDDGRTWSPRIRVHPPSPYNCVGTGRARFARLDDGSIAVPMETWQQSTPDHLMPQSEWYFRSLMYRSADEGKTWQAIGNLGNYTCESDVLSLPSGGLLAATRFQRVKLPADPPDLASPMDMSNKVGGHSVFKQTAIMKSDDGGVTWSAPMLVTGWLQQTGCLIRLSDGMVILAFGHKTEVDGKRFGQRVMVSLDEGETWSRTVYELHHGGLYANSVVLPDDTIVTVHDGRNTDHVKLSVLRWKPPSREEVSKGGFFAPRSVATG